MKIAFHTLGCKVNQYETEAMKEEFSSHGAEIVGEDEVADAYIINTCTVTSVADSKSRKYIRRMKKLSPDSLMVVTGCYAQTAGEELKAMPDVDMVIGNNLKSTICDEVIYQLTLRDAGKGFVKESKVLPFGKLVGYEEYGIVVSSESQMQRAYIKIEEGCNRFCAYCKIPYARGTVRSRGLEEIIIEAKALVGRGYKELVLTGINTALYGCEEGFKFDRRADEVGLTGIEAVLKRLDELDGDFRVRLSSLEPNVVDKEHIERIVKYKRLCRHLHLSIQSGSDKVLKAMKRRYTRAEYLDIVDELRSFDPMFGITTDIIVGFPGESEADFNDTLDLIKRVKFGKVHAFKFSPRKGTEAAAYKETVTPTEKTARINKLIEEAESVACEYQSRNFGTVQRVLVETFEEDYATGYTSNYIKVYIRDGERKLAAGEFAEVRLVAIYKEGCLAEVV